MARLSYFAEKRGQNKDPNFFNCMTANEIRKNVKRIIKDIKFDMIQDYDYIYFFSPRVIEACICEAQMNYYENLATSNALNFYINEYLNKGIKAFPSIDIYMEQSNAIKQHKIIGTRAQHWYTIWNIFECIRNNPNIDLNSLFAYIKMIDPNDISNL